MSNGLPSSLVRFLKSSKSHNLLTIPTKISSPDTSTLFTPHFKQTTISSHKHFYAKTPRPPVHTQLNKLPRSSTDIKGIDQMAHKIMNRRLNKNPTLVKNIHFQLKFYPADSVIGMARKSNIAYTFTNSSGAITSTMLL